ncbi:MAG: UbiA family prenyltransferase [Nitrososphaerota archaeon]
MYRVKAYFTITRPINGFMMFLAVLSGIVLSYEKNINPTTLLYAFITAFTLNGSSMIFNDYFDREVDKVNAPHRPIPSGLISPMNAVVYAVILGVVGLASSYMISFTCMMIATASYIATLLYNMRLKRTGLLGNLIVSIVVATPFIFGSTMSDGYVSERIIAFIIPVILSNTGREVIKGIADAEGDAVRNVMSIARTKGLKKAAEIGAILYLSAVAFSPIPYLLNYVSEIYLPIVLIADAGFIDSSRSILKKPTRENALKVKNQTLLWMLIALIAFILGGLL